MMGFFLKANELRNVGWRGDGKENKAQVTCKEYVNKAELHY